MSIIESTSSAGTYRHLFVRRGEHFRHARNQTNRNFIARRIEYSSANRTLPIEQIFGENIPSDDDEPHTPSSGSRSRSQPASNVENRDRPEWRKRALALLFSQAPLRPTDELLSPTTLERDSGSNVRPVVREIPLLAELCLRVILPYCQGQSFAEDLVPYLPPHLRRLLLRWSAVHAPLNRNNLYALCEPELGGHADGDLVVVGPYASLPANYFKRVEAEATDTAAQVAESSSAFPMQQEAAMEVDSSGSWDSDSSKEDETPPLTLLALVSTPLSTPTLFTLPPSLTHLALLSLPTLTPIHRLPRLLPLLEVLDLSYNLWIGQPKIFGNTGEGGETLLERTEWSRWSRLRVLGLRECGVSKKIAARVNQGRWVDVEVIGIIDNG